MVYRAIGIMSGSSLDGLDIVFAEFHENAGKWEYDIKASACYPYTLEWENRLRNAISLNAMDYQLLDADYGHYIGSEVNRFISEFELQYQVAIISSHGHTSFHLPSQKMTAQLGDGAAIAAETGLPVVSNLRAMDVALGGQGAPIVPVGERLLLGFHEFFLNIGGIANISRNLPGNYAAFDVCPANRVLNILASEKGVKFDEGGKIAATGKVQAALLERLNAEEYYRLPFPKSLANEFGTGVIFPLLANSGLSIEDQLRTYSEHIAIQLKNAILKLHDRNPATPGEKTLLATGGGALNQFLVDRIREQLSTLDINVSVPDDQLVNYKEALVMALIGVLRWRQEYNVLASVTGASRDSIGGALWNGQEA